MGAGFRWKVDDILDIIRLEVIRVSCWWWLYQYGWCRTKEGALDWAPFFYINCTIPVPELNFQCLWSAWKWHFKDDYWQLITALRYAKTPLLHGVSPLNWRKRVGIEPTYDITATHQLWRLRRPPGSHSLPIYYSTVFNLRLVAFSLKPVHFKKHFGTPDRIWTCDLLLRRQALYPAELRAQT